ncbi:MAG: ANTAR domain-containing protein, partial [Syntrophobacteria bacterium]
AKDVLMRRRDMRGEEAHRWIQKRSMDSRKSMREVAEAVLLSEEL